MKEMGGTTRVVRETSIKNAEIAEDFLEKRREASVVFFEEMQRGRVLGAPLWARVLKKIPVNRGGAGTRGGGQEDRRDQNSCLSCLSCPP